MLKRKIFIISFTIFVAVSALFALYGCSFSRANAVKEIISGDNFSDSLAERVIFGKKYYYLGYDGYDAEQYYSFSEDGKASYTHIMKDNGKVTFHQVLNFKWTYAKNGECLLIHNGTDMIAGKQDDAFGLSRVMKVSKNLVYWSASGENTYYICEDFLDEIPNYGKFLENE